MHHCILGCHLCARSALVVDIGGTSSRRKRERPNYGGSIRSLTTACARVFISCTSDVQLYDMCLCGRVWILVNSCFSSACIMVVHIMCLTTSGGLPLFTRKRGDCDPVSITAASVFFHNRSSCVFLCYAFCWSAEYGLGPPIKVPSVRFLCVNSS